MTKPPPRAPAEKVVLYEQLVATLPGAQRKGAAVPYTSLNGHMYSFFTVQGTVALRLPEGDRQAFLKKYRASLVEQYGVVMKEYVEVPDRLLARTHELAPYFAMSHAYIRTLKPKPTTRKKSPAASPKAAPSRTKKATPKRRR